MDQRAWRAFTHPGQDHKQIRRLAKTGNAIQEQGTPKKSQFGKKYIVKLADSKQGKTLPTDWAIACWQIGLDSRQLGLIS